MCDFLLVDGDVLFRSLWSLTHETLSRARIWTVPWPMQKSSTLDPGNVGNLCYFPVRVKPSPSSYILDSLFLTHRVFVCSLLYNIVVFHNHWSVRWAPGAWLPGSLLFTHSKLHTLLAPGSLLFTHSKRSAYFGPYMDSHGGDTLWAGPGRLLTGALKVSCTREQNLWMAGWFRELKARCPFWWR